jgi:segregation and condensation protein A
MLEHEGSPGVPVMGPLDDVPPPPVVPVVPVMPAVPAGPAVRFGEGRRPETATHVQVAEFDGPLALLLSLIEARQLDVLTVPLDGLADAYLDALATLDTDRLANVSAFVAVAAQLILIKSRAMLPRRPVLDPTAIPDDGVDPEAELRARLIVYKAHRDAGRQLADGALLRIGLFRREPTTARAAGLAGARPMDAPPLDPSRLVAALARLAVVAPPPPPPPEVVPRTITLTERAEIIRAALRGAPTVVLQDLLQGVRDRVVIAITFLAMLELMKRREIVVEQAEPWGPIVARQTTPEERAAAGIAPGVDVAAPIDESLESFA